MGKRIRLLLKTILFLVILVFCLIVTMLVVRRKESSYKYSDFFEMAKKDQIDVLFMGSSHVINAINPAVLYKNYGYTSYNMGGHGSVLQSTYWELMEALEYCTPEWIVLDAYMLEKNYKYIDVMDDNYSDFDRNSGIQQLHLNMDAWPLDKLKIQAINDLIQDEKVRRQFLFDYIVYHDRWGELDKDDYLTLFGKHSRNQLFGAEMRYQVEIAPENYPSPEEGALLDENTVGQEYLVRIIEECQNRGIGIVVTYIPFNLTYDEKRAANTACAISNEYGVPFINLVNEGIINLYTDLNDSGHLNVLGASKITNRIGAWFYQNAELTDHRADSAYAKWAERVANYRNEIREMLYSEDNLYREMELLGLGEESGIIYVNQGSDVFHDYSAKNLIRQLSGTNSIFETEGPYILVYDVSYSGQHEAFGPDGLYDVTTSMGTLVYQPVEEKFRFLYTREDEEFNYLYDDEHIKYDIQILIYDKDTGEVLSHRYFRSFGDNYRID